MRHSAKADWQRRSKCLCYGCEKETYNAVKDVPGGKAKEIKSKCLGQIWFEKKQGEVRLLSVRGEASLP